MVIIIAKQNLNQNHPVSFSDLSIVKTPYCREIERGLPFWATRIMTDSQQFTIFADGNFDVVILSM